MTADLVLEKARFLLQFSTRITGLLRSALLTASPAHPRGPSSCSEALGLCLCFLGPSLSAPGAAAHSVPIAPGQAAARLWDLWEAQAVGGRWPNASITGPIGAGDVGV